ncbi:MAG TPA: hypothetical protein VK506_13785 [Conexibacter sp.]|nr:hypothetical protein [Conexibacter sp.]
MAKRKRKDELTYFDEAGYAHKPCHICGVDCSTHPDAGNPLALCGDCGKATCPDHRDETPATRCSSCRRNAA